MAKVFVIDDSSTARNLLKMALEESKYEVVEASNGVEALKLIKDIKDVKLILCDVNMPEMDGLTLCKKIKEIPDWSSIPILMVTTESTLEMKSKGKEIGVLGWVTKPVDPPKLMATINKIVGK